MARLRRDSQLEWVSWNDINTDLIKFLYWFLSIDQVGFRGGVFIFTIFFLLFDIRTSKCTRLVLTFSSCKTLVTFYILPYSVFFLSLQLFLIFSFNIFPKYLQQFDLRKKRVNETGWVHFFYLFISKPIPNYYLI